jgi:hypothetical protein
MTRLKGILRHRLAAVLAATLASCGPKAAAGPTYTVLDSAGVSIAENQGEAPAGGGGWAISAEPTLSIGAREGDDAYLFSRIWGATRLSDGRIAVADNGAPDIRIFGPAGRHLRTFGTRGEGPGELKSPVLVGTLPGDTLVVVDRLLRRLYVFDPDTGLVRGNSADPGIEGFLLTEGMFGSGSALIRRSVWQDSDPNGLRRFPTDYFSVALDGAVEHDFGEFPGDETIFATQSVEGGTMVMSTGRPFGKQAAVAVGTDRWYYGSQDAWEIQAHDQTGALTRLIRWDRKPIAVTNADVSSLVAQMDEEADDTERARQFRRMVREAPIPEFFPAYGGIYTDARDYLWVEAYELPGDTVRATTIFDPEGRMVGTVTLPNHFQVEEIGLDYLLGVHVDDMGVQYLWMYGLTRGARG